MCGLFIHIKPDLTHSETSKKCGNKVEKEKKLKSKKKNDKLEISPKLDVVE